MRILIVEDDRETVSGIESNRGLWPIPMQHASTAFAILATVPFSMVGALIALFVTRRGVDISVGVGIATLLSRRSDVTATRRDPEPC